MTVAARHPALVALMESGVARGVFPGGVLLVHSAGECVHLSSHGRCARDPAPEPVRDDTCFDLASLTKVLAAVPLAMDLILRGRLGLEDQVSAWVPAFRGAGREEVLVRHLLEHTSGLVAWRAYFHEVAAARGGALAATVAGRDAVRSLVAAELPGSPPGTRAVYSDAGFILLDWVLECAGGATLDRQLRARITKPLGADLFFIDLKRPASARAARRGRRFAATERCAWRGHTLRGEVHDDNAWVMGGVSGHAGLFGDARAVARMARAWLDSYAGRASLFDRELLRRFWRRSQVEGSTRALGFDTPAEQGSAAGGCLGPRAVGHTGFTGTSLWIDPDRELIVVLLTNRVHPRRDNDAIRAFRPQLHDRVVEVVAAK